MTHRTGASEPSGCMSSCFNRTIAIIGAIAGLITAIATLLMALSHWLDATQTTVDPSVPPSIVPTTVIQPPPVSQGNFCCGQDNLRYCPLVSPLPVGVICTCYDTFSGVPLGNGWTCP